VKPYCNHAGVTIYHEDARNLMAALPVDRLITDPVWPNADRRLAGSENPAVLLASVLDMAVTRTVVVQLGRASDPRFLAAVPYRWPFLCVSWLRYVPCSYRGR
jgi:hypothetical protein